MVFQIKKSLSSSRIFLEIPLMRNIRIVLLLALFLMYELSVTVEAKSTATSAYNATVVSKTRRYLTIGKQGITGEISANSYAKVQRHTYGFKGVITIKGVKMQQYLAMNSTGGVYLVATKTKEALFIDLRKTAVGYAAIRSKSYPSQYLAISATGSVHGSTKTNSDDTKLVFFPAI